MNDHQKVFLLAVVERLEHAIVEDEARELGIEMRTQHSQIEGDAQ